MPRIHTWFRGLCLVVATLGLALVVAKSQTRGPKMSSRPTTMTMTLQSPKRASQSALVTMQHSRHPPFPSKQKESMVVANARRSALSSPTPRRDLQEGCQDGAVPSTLSCSPTQTPTQSSMPTDNTIPTRPPIGPTNAATSVPTVSPPTTRVPTLAPTFSPTTASPTGGPTIGPTGSPTRQPTSGPTALPTMGPTNGPTDKPTFGPTTGPTVMPTVLPTALPSVLPTTFFPTSVPTRRPSPLPTTQNPTSQPTRVPTRAPTFMPLPLPTHNPTTSPTLEPTVVPTTEPTYEPTDPPTGEPTDEPTLSPTTAVPTAQPSEEPSAAPSLSMRPSASPTISPQPTVDPFGVDVEAGLDDDNNRVLTVTCRPSIPVQAKSITTQLIQYDYILNVENETVVADLLPPIEQAISEALTLTFLDCQFGLLRDFYVYQLNSAPNDRVASGCLLTEQVAGASCYTIAGQLLTSFFYLEHDDDDQDGDGSTTNTRQRQLQIQETQIADENVANAFAEALANIFASGQLGEVQVVGSAFSGITNRVPPPPPPPENRTPQIVGGVFGAIVGTVLIGVCLVYVLKRQSEEAANQYYQEAMDAVDSEIDDIPSMAPDFEPRAATIVNDEDDDLVATSMPMYSATLQDKSRAVEFIGTAEGDVEPLRAAAAAATAPPTEGQRERMLKETKRELGPTAYEPQITRGYGVSDTVDL